MICLALTGKTLKDDFKALDAYRGKIDCAELRADYLDSGEVSSLKDVPARAGLPLILTVRRASDGGCFAGTEAERIRIIREGLKGTYQYVDLEEDFKGDIPSDLLSGKTIIRSFHDFEGVTGLKERLRTLPRSGSEIPKAAVMPKSTRDCLAITDAARAISGPKIIIGMGSWGFFTRVLYKRLGSILTFCSVPESSAAPGHTDPDTLRLLYRADKVDSSTQVNCVIGNPVMHSRSPEIHNRGYDLLSIDAVYVPFQVDDVEEFKLLMEAFDIRGVSVTLPHKEAILRILDREDDAVRRIGACNTVVRDHGVYTGYNTDAEGFCAPLGKVLPLSRLNGLRTLVVGAGGAARSVVYALSRAGADISIVNRTYEKAVALAGEFGCTAIAESNALALQGFDLVVQTTSAGMEPHVEEDPLPNYQFSGKEIVYDIIYAPPVTRFLSRAQAANCRTIGGLQMLRAQGYAQFKLFTGRDYPEAL